MLKLSAAHLKEQRRNDPKKRLVWLDIGGGTGAFLFSTRGKQDLILSAQGGTSRRWTRWARLESRHVPLLTSSLLQYFPIADFDAVYVLDLCAPLLEVSRKRFEARGFKNVQCLLQDATTFVLPEWERDGVDPNGAVSGKEVQLFQEFTDVETSSTLSP